VNEDSFAIVREHGLFMVADGVGGTNAGDVASRMTIDCVRSAFESDMTWPSVAGEECRTPGASLLNAALQRANTRVHGLGQCELDKADMASTFAGLLVVEARVVIAHVGDSRVYRLRDGQISQLTEDHSLLNACVRAGSWDPSRAAEFPRKEVITHAVGFEATLKVETRLDAPMFGDVYLICSDGLTGMLPDEEIQSILLKYPDLTRATAELITRANDRGGYDNITVVLVRWLRAER
jgi:protein phosphatase